MMTNSEPSREWQLQQHQRMMQKDPIAFAELCEEALPHLISFLSNQFPQYEAHLHEMVAIDCLLDYQKRAKRFDPEKSRLFAYLRMAARRDMMNALDKEHRRDRRLFDIDDPNVQVQLPDEATAGSEFELDEWLQQHTDLSRQEILAMLDSELNATDKQLLLLMLENERDSERYAEVMGISDQDESVKRKDVKRAKDRLTKKLQRFGKRIDNT